MFVLSTVNKYQRPEPRIILGDSLSCPYNIGIVHPPWLKREQLLNRNDARSPNGSSMNRRRFLKAALAARFLPGIWSQMPALAWAASATMSHVASRVRPGDPEWPSEARWNSLSLDIGGRLIKVQSPLSVCRDTPDSESCRKVFKELKNPYYIGDQLGLTQTCGSWSKEAVTAT